MALELNGKKIIVGVTGGIAAYKACELVNVLFGEGASVRVVMTEAATKFVGPQTFQALTNHKVYLTLWDDTDPESIEHISLAHWPDVIVIYPATANTIAKIAHGFADNLLTTVALASQKKTNIILAPAMNSAMWDNPITQANLASLVGYSRYTVVNPRSGVLACREEGSGKVADVTSIVKQITAVLAE